MVAGPDVYICDRCIYDASGIVRNDLAAYRHAPSKNAATSRSELEREETPQTQNQSNENRIFISYRRGDSSDVTGRIYDRLTAHFGKENVFKDVDSIPLGVDFRQVIDKIIADCAVIIVVIGNQWVGYQESEDRRSIDDPRDFVRIEVEASLRREIPIITAFVRHANMPSEDELPPPIKPLAFRNGISIRSDPDFHRDVDRLISGLDQHLGKA